MKKILKTIFIDVGIFFVSVLFHNGIYAIFKIEEPVFFTMAIASVFFLPVYLAYQSLKYLFVRLKAKS